MTNDNHVYWEYGYTILKMKFSQAEGLTMDIDSYLAADKRPLNKDIIVINSYAAKNGEQIPHIEGL